MGAMVILARYLIVALNIILLGWAPAALSAEAGPSAAPGEQIDITADTLSVGDSGTELEAKGNVELRRGETTLRAEEVRANRKTQDVEAQGNVSVEDPQGSLKADSVRLNLQQETGEIQNGDLFYSRNHLSLSGRRLQKLAGQTYHIDDGFFTTCICASCPPTWKIGADQIDLTREGTGVVRGATFYLLDIPILYLPYAVFPVRTERESGFLFPRIGSSTKEGFKFEQPFFWALSKSTDATFGVDVETRARIGILGELRTILNRDAGGQLNVAYFNEGLRKGEEQSIGDRTIANQEIPQNRWNIVATHRHASPLGWNTYSDIFAVSDDLFLREIEVTDAHTFEFVPGVHDRDLKTSRYSRSRFGFFRDWGDVRLQTDWAFYQDFIQEDAPTLHKTPQVFVRGRHLLGESPLELRWWAEGVNYLRREGADGLRFDLRPELFLPVRVLPYLLGSFAFALRETAYHLYQDDGLSDRNSSRELFEVRGKLGTSLGRVFALDGWNLARIRHVVEPEINYLFIPRAKDRDLPIFDGTDRINRRNLLTFALTNRLWGRFAEKPIQAAEDRDSELVGAPIGGEVRELGTLRLALSYDVDRERKGGDTLSDLDLALRVNPRDYLNLGFDTGLNPGPWQVTQAAVVMSVRDPRPITRRVLDRDFMQPNRVDLSYRFIRRGFLAELAENANLTTLKDERLIHRNVLSQFGARAFFHLTDHLLLSYGASFNARDGKFASNRGGIKLLSQCECWTVSFTVDRSTNPDKTSFKFDLNLLGLSSGSKAMFE
ncbi:MAG: LPS-assembly protein LptD [Deltaproteobacteria bacterium]|nr:LPS-assembly protein LptD [Deltaproteobacteria bacterium]